MKIVALVKYTPDSTGDRHFAADQTVDRDAVSGVLSELDEYTVEQALQVAEANSGTEITYLTMGPAAATEGLRKALSMGGDQAVHILDDGLHGSDALTTSKVLAAAVSRLGFDMVLTGMASTDAGMGVIGSMVAERLGIGQISHAGQLSVSGSTVTIERETESGGMTVTGDLPALVSVTDRTGQARYPSFKGIMAAKKKPVQTLTLADLEIDPSQAGLAAAATAVLDTAARPARQAGEIVNDDGDGGAKVAEFLTANRFV
jgi:electron transfer flavoprotein beta subunit